MSSRPNLLIVGASTRAAAFSAIRAGFRPHGLDQFADADLVALCPTSLLDLHEDETRVVGAARLGRRQWLYTGPLENHPALVERLQAEGRLLGNASETLRSVRDPWLWTEALSRAGLPAPRLASASERPPKFGRWLRKPKASAGGRAIAMVEESDARSDASSYFQGFIDGPTISALYVAAGGRSQLLGVARQNQGIPGAPFVYRGGVAPFKVSAPTRAMLRRAGEALASGFALVGLFGVDFILNGGEPWPIEVNPRYTASVELYELATRRAILLDHVAACVEGRLPLDVEPPAFRCIGKRVLYARRRLVAPSIPVPDRPPDLFAVPEIADVPRPGTIINPLEPILTIFAEANSFEDCSTCLDGIEDEWMKRL